VTVGEVSAGLETSSGSSHGESIGQDDDAFGSTDDAITGTDEGGSTEGEDSTTGAADPCAGELETFAIDPGWTAIGFPDTGNEYGWVGGGTQAGGDPGEVGGTFQRSGGRTVFADAITPTIADACISARGRMVIARNESSFNSYIQFGHFALGGGIGAGFALAEGTDDTVRMFMFAGGADEVAFTIEDPGVAREWSYVYDPSTAMMTLTLEGYGSLSRPVAPQAAIACVGLDAFGIHHEPHDNAGDSPGQLEVYLDEIAYTR
jgi:hypothetical protein